MDAMRLSIRLWVILFHSSRNAISKSRTVAGGLGHAAMRRPSMSQTCSIGFRSGEHAGYSIRCIVSASSMFSTRRALCGRALSSWKTKESPMAPACVAFSVLFRRAVNCIYRSSVDVVARGRPAPGRRLTFPVSWNQFQSLATTLLATPTASATLRCVWPDSSLSITRHALGGFRDEAHFWLNGYVNKQNCRIWSEANPQVYVETPLHPEKLTVWCALWAGGILFQKRCRPQRYSQW
ncbi:hypothetical protein TNCV_2459471 [Trichonephila clavipes]|nr:hypothetical protein TNCV_2459471 [Trichonephila clavipes]